MMFKSNKWNLSQRKFFLSVYNKDTFFRIEETFLSRYECKGQGYY